MSCLCISTYKRSSVGRDKQMYSSETYSVKDMHVYFNNNNNNNNNNLFIYLLT